uniref:DUF1223 domain-containing protein n=1 Tax=candidate division WOR-3 bacterium TaxID=2052148 RepID=A0A7C4CB46_UNCW3
MQARLRGPLVFGGLVLLAGCSAAPVIPLVPTNRVVLAELFTWQRCPYCPHAARALDSLTREFSDSVVVIAYHRPIAGDTLSPGYIEFRRALYYESGGEPATVFDGGRVTRTPGPEYNYETFRNQILGARSVTPKAQLNVSVATDGSGKVTVTVKASGVDSTPTESLRLFVAVFEDSIRERLAGATDTVFNSVARMLLPDSSGCPLRLFRAETTSVSQEFTVAAPWKLEHVGVAAWVQDMNSRRVLQASVQRRIRPGR